MIGYGRLERDVAIVPAVVLQYKGRGDKEGLHTLKHSMIESKKWVTMKRRL